MLRLLRKLIETYQTMRLRWIASKCGATFVNEPHFLSAGENPALD